jgi:hypothetical protein
VSNEGKVTKISRLTSAFRGDKFTSASFLLWATEKTENVAVEEISLEGKWGFIQAGEHFGAGSFGNPR